MTPSDIAQLVTAGAAVGAAVVGAIGLAVSVHNSRKIAGVESKQDEQHLATNSRLDQLLAATAKQQRAEGHAEGLAVGRAEQRE